MSYALLKRLFAIQFVLWAALVSHAGEGVFKGGFSDGAAAYDSGDFEKASGVFQTAADKAPSFGAYYNLGNAEWQRERTGEAILAWERALWIDPYNAAAKSNLRLARRTAQLASPELTWWEACSMWLPVNAWAWIASISLWMSVALVVLPGVFRQQKTGWHQGLASAGFALFLLTLPALAGVHARAAIGVVLTKDTPLRLTATFEAQTVARLAAGELVRAQKTRGDYVFVLVGGDSSGWIEKSKLGFIAVTGDKLP